MKFRSLRHLNSVVEKNRHDPKMLAECKKGLRGYLGRPDADRKRARSIHLKILRAEKWLQLKSEQETPITPGSSPSGKKKAKRRRSRKSGPLADVSGKFSETATK